MSSGLIPAVAVPASNYTTLYTVPANTLANVSVSLCNVSTGDVDIRVAIGTSGSPTTGFIEYNRPLPPGGVFRETGITMAAGEKVVVWASSTGIDATGWKFEEAA